MLSRSDDKLVPFFASKDIAVESRSVSIDWNGQKLEVPFEGLYALTVEGAAAIMDGAIDTTGEDGKIERQSVLGAFNHAIDLFQRAAVRQAKVATLEDPEKAIKQAVAAMVSKAGFDEVTARGMVIAQRKVMGLPVPAGE